MKKQLPKDSQRVVQPRKLDGKDRPDTFPVELSLFSNIRNQVPTAALTLPEVAERVRTCPELKKATEAILKTHKRGIVEGFKTIPKKAYQDHKVKALPAILPGGIVNTRSGQDKKRTITPSGYICLDIDENTPQELRGFMSRAKAGEFKNLVFAALSVSGKINGSMTAFFKVNLPRSWKSTPLKVRKELGLKKNAPWPANLQKINEAYHRVFRYLLLNNAGIKAGTAGKSIFNVRYLSHDPEAYLATNQPAFTLSALLTQISRIENSDQRESFAVDVSTITASDAFAFAEAYAKKKGTNFVQGQKHLFLKDVAIACNLLGVPREAVEEYASNKAGGRIRTNCISYPYQKYQDNFGKWKYKLEQNKKLQTLEGKAGQKLSEIITPEAAVGKMIVSPTGSGKTFFVSTVQGRKIIVVPTVGLVKNVAGEYQAVPYWGGDRDKSAALAADFIVTTYASFESLSSLLSDHREGIKVFIDEAHAFTSATSPNFQLRELTNLLRESQKFESVTLLTGTELYNHHPFLRDMERVKITIPTGLKTFSFVDSADVLKATADIIRESVVGGRFPLVLFNNKSEEGRLGTLQNLLKDLPGLRYFNSDTKDDSDFLEITEKGNIATGIRGLITTSVLKEGNNIYNHYDFDVVVVGAFHASEIQQFSSRPRAPKSNHVSIIRSNRRKILQAPFNAVKLNYFIENSAKAICDELNTQDGLTTNYHESEFRARKAVANNPILFDGKYLVDYLALSNQVFRLEATAQNRNEDLMIEALKEYGLTYKGKNVSKAKQSLSEKKMAQASRQAAKKSKNEAYLETVKSLKEEAAPLAETTAALQGRAHTLSPVQKTVYSRFERLVDLCPNQTAALDYMEDIGAKKATFELLLKRLKIERLRRDEAYMKTNRKFAIVIKAIHSKIKAKDRLTSAQIVSKIESSLKLDRSLDLSYLELEHRNDRYLKIARLFFDLKRKDVRNAEGEKVVAYEICTLTFGGLLERDQKIKVQNSPSVSLTDVLY